MNNDIDLKELIKLFKFNIKDVSKMYDVSLSTFKRMYQRLQIGRYPYRIYSQLMKKNKNYYSIDYINDYIYEHLIKMEKSRNCDKLNIIIKKLIIICNKNFITNKSIDYVNKYIKKNIEEKQTIEKKMTDANITLINKLKLIEEQRILQENIINYQKQQIILNLDLIDEFNNRLNLIEKFKLHLLNNKNVSNFCYDKYLGSKYLINDDIKENNNINDLQSTTDNSVVLPMTIWSCSKETKETNNIIIDNIDENNIDENIDVFSFLNDNIDDFLF